jgi:serine/threonine-protein kinase RsbW
MAEVSMNDAMKLKVELPKIHDIELVAIEGLERLGRHLGIADDKIGEARIIVAEAIINALEHAGPDNPGVRVEFTMTSKELIIFVEDEGKGFAPSEVKDPDLQSKLGTRDKRGWGLKLMKSLSDDFRIESGEKGTRITITKLLS